MDKIDTSYLPAFSRFPLLDGCQKGIKLVLLMLLLEQITTPLLAQNPLAALPSSAQDTNVGTSSSTKVSLNNPLSTALDSTSNQLLHVTQILPELVNEQDFSFYEEFCARRTQTDDERKVMKEQIISFYGGYGFSRTQAYQLHQAISFSRQHRGSGVIRPIGENFYQFLRALITNQKTDLGPALKDLIGDTTYKNITTKAVEQNRKLGPGTYRDQPITTTLLFDGDEIVTTQYDRQTASDLLANAGYELRSTNLQEDEIGNQHTDGYTCLEGLSTETVEGLLVLMARLKKNVSTDKSCKLFINGGTEVGHAQDENILLGYIRNGHKAKKSHIEAHGVGFTVDIRLTGKEGLWLKKVFADPDGIGSTRLQGEDGKRHYFKYRFHGAGPSFHLHLTIYSKETYLKLSKK